MTPQQASVETRNVCELAPVVTLLLVIVLFSELRWWLSDLTFSMPLPRRPSTLLLAASVDSGVRAADP